MAKTLPTNKAKATRITRSIRFETVLLDYVKEQARVARRSPNWMVNEIIRRAQDNAPAAAAAKRSP